MVAKALVKNVSFPISRKFLAWLRVTLCVAASVCVLFPEVVNSGEISTAARLEILKEVYSDHIMNQEGNLLVMKDGSKLVIDDGREKSHSEKMSNPDIEDMLSQVYPLATCIGANAKPSVNFDPGRIRHQGFLRSVYGSSKGEVAKRIGSVDWFGERVHVSKIMSVDQRVEGFVRDLKSAPTRLKKYLLPNAGSFVWRPIAGTKRLSAHSFGIAIDISTANSDYWRWSGGKPGNVKVFQNRIPMEIVEAFEKIGFIWGGRWYHYDTMHFEYRPELIKIGRLACEAGASRQGG
ncbi:MAG: M15 family metallopeptidase [Alphaproteobacteria bacterium]|nr:M15 family metallopeptidase [Alphaproteobacteria bacterium]